MYKPLKLFSVSALMVLLAGASQAAVGIYEPVPLEKKFDHELLKDSGELEDYFSRRGVRYRDDVLEAYIKGIADKLVPAVTDNYIDYRFYVFRDPSPNAFALPDGQIYINTGMLARLNDEAQLASLIAHEINHVAGHHSIIAVRADHQRGVASAVFSGLLAGVGGGWAALADLGQNLAFTLSSLGYSRDLEEEADKRGFDRLLESGYDVRAMSEVFEILNRDPEGEQPRQRTKWSTHPDLKARADYLRQLAAEVPADQLAGMRRNEVDFHGQMRATALMTVRDYTLSDYPRTALAVARDLTARHPEDAELYMAMGEAWLSLGPGAELDPDDALSESDKRKNRMARARKTRAERREELLAAPAGPENLRLNLISAEKAFQQALTLQPDLAEAHRGLGELYQEQGKLSDAARAYLNYVKMAPDAPDRKRVVSMLKSLAQQIKTDTQDDT